MPPEEFRAEGHRLVDRLADFLETLPSRPVAPGLSPKEVRARLGGGALPQEGTAAGPLLDEAASLLFESSVFSGHPRFFGYVVSSPAPVGALADLLAAVVNPNVGAWYLSPMATEIELQAIRWIAEMVGFPTDCGGILTSGGNMANFVAFLAARRAKAPWNVRAEGAVPREGASLCLYASGETHTWVHKAADLFGLGTEAIRWVDTDARQRLDVGALERRIREDRAGGLHPFLVVGTAGTVSTGAVDPLPRMAEVCRREGLWLHVDGAYGGFAAGVPGAPEDLAGLAMADSIAVDPHKWLYAPLEAGCTLVRDARSLGDAFEYRPAYYQSHDDLEGAVDFHSRGLQNSRGFRALKVWLGLRLAGQRGYRRMIADDIALAQALFDAASRHGELEAVTRGLSIATFRYVPEDMAGGARDEAYLDRLNRELVEALQRGGEAYLSNAVVGGRYVLRACIVNFRTTERDVAAVPEIVARAGRALDRTLRPSAGARGK